MAQQQSLGVVIHITDIGEADKIVTLYSPTVGQFSGIAKGAKRSLRRFVNKLELFSLLDLTYSDHYSLPIINEAELVNSHLALRQDYQAYTAAALVSELFRTWTHHHDPDPELFGWLVWVLDRLCLAEGRLPSLVLFLVKFYSHLGYQPQLVGCLVCRRLDSGAAPFRFQASHGAILCRHCQHSPSAPMLSISTVKLLAKALTLPMDKLGRLRFTASSLNEALALFRAYDRTLLDREGPAWAFVGQAAER